MSADDRNAVSESLADQTEAFTLKALAALHGTRSDVATFALLTAAYIGTRHSVELAGCAPEDVDAFAEQIIALAMQSARTFSKIMVAEGTVTFDAPHFHKRSAAELRVLMPELHLLDDPPDPPA